MHNDNKNNNKLKFERFRHDPHVLIRKLTKHNEKLKKPETGGKMIIAYDYTKQTQ